MYKNDTSSVTIKVPGGSNGNFLSLLIKAVVSPMYDGRAVVKSCRNQSTNREMFFVRALFKATINLPELPGLCHKLIKLKSSLRQLEFEF